MAKTPFDNARVIWCSSLGASPKFYDSEDWQLTKTKYSYEDSKYQIDIIGTNLDRIALNSNEGKPIRHFVSEPGICSTPISRALATGIVDYIKHLMFYVVSPPFLYIFFLVILTRIRLASLVRHIIPSILSKLLLWLCILSLFLYVLYHSFWTTIVASPYVLEHKLDDGAMNVLV